MNLSNTNPINQSMNSNSINNNNNPNNINNQSNYSNFSMNNNNNNNNSNSNNNNNNNANFLNRDYTNKLNNFNNYNNIGIASPLITEPNNNNNNNLSNSNFPISTQPNPRSTSLINRGKAVMGIQPLSQPINYKEEVRRDDLTKKKFDEINTNLDIFRTELTNTMRKINKNQSKLKVDTVIDEITDFKNTFVDSLQKAERKKEQDNDFIMKEIKELKNDLRSNYQESQNNYKIIRNFQDDIFEFEKEITNRILRMEKNQADQFDKIYGLINNLTLLKQHGQNKGDDRDIQGEVDKQLNSGDNKYEREGDDELMKKLKSAQEKNTELLKDTMNDNKGLFDKGKTTDLKDAYRIKALDERQKEMPFVKQKLAQSNLNTKLKTKNKLRSYLLLGQSIARFRRSRLLAADAVKIQALEYFINNYKKYSNTIEEWVKNAIKVPITSVKQVDNLELDLSDQTVLGDNPNQEMKDTFQRLKARLQGIIENLGTHLYSNPFDVNTMTWMRIAITSDYIVPYGFYYNFVLSRILVDKGELKKLDDRHILSILSVYIMITIIVKKILMEEMKTTQSTNVRKNYKMIASVFYHSLIGYLKKNMQISNKIPNYANFVKNQCKESPQLDIKFDKNSSVFYRQALKSFYTKVEKTNLNIRAKARFLLDKIDSDFHNFSKDSNSNDIWEIVNYLYSERQMQSYFKLAEMNNFKLTIAILNWAQQFKGFIYSTEG